MDATPDDQQDLTIFVQNLLKEMQGRFQHMSDAIIGRIDDMGTRIDDLEKSVGDLMAQTGNNETAGGDAAKAINQSATKN